MDSFYIKATLRFLQIFCKDFLIVFFQTVQKIRTANFFAVSGFLQLERDIKCRSTPKSPLFGDKFLVWPFLFVSIALIETRDIRYKFKKWRPTFIFVMDWFLFAHMLRQKVIRWLAKLIQYANFMLMAANKYWQFLSFSCSPYSALLCVFHYFALTSLMFVVALCIWCGNIVFVM